MTSSYQQQHHNTHAPNNHLSRRASVATAPYTIPPRHGSLTHTQSPLSPPTSTNIHIPVHQPHHQQQTHNSIHPTTGRNSYTPYGTPNSTHDLTHPHQQLSSSVPVLSREFVVRRISEGESGRLKEELKCEACGKGYKHISSLAKHLWEHTPEWNVTKKLLISKHQQVQLLEAASILVGMNEVNPIKEQTIVEDEEIRFNPKYTDENEHDDDDEDDEDEADRSSNSPSPFLKDFKNRNGSISQVPPSGLHSNSPARNITTGGFLDVPRNGHSNLNKLKKHSIVSQNSTVLNANHTAKLTFDDEPQEVFGMDQ